MTASLLPNGKQTFLDTNGVVLAAGSVYFYEPGTTTPKDTWQDAAQSTLNTNPVVLDAAGTATIYGTGSYRQIVKDSSGVTIWDKETADFIASVPVLATQSQAETGTNNTTFMSPLRSAQQFTANKASTSDATTGTATGKWMSPATVKTQIETGSFNFDTAGAQDIADYVQRTGTTPFSDGAKLDGSDSDHASFINSAIDRVITAGGGRVWLPPIASGTRWKLGSALQLYKTGYQSANLILEGVGARAEVSRLGTTGDTFKIGDGTNSIYYVDVRNIHLFNDSGKTSGLDFNIRKAALCNIQNVITENTYAGIYTLDVNQLSFERCEFIMPTLTTGRGAYFDSTQANSGSRSDIIILKECTIQAKNTGSDGIVCYGRIFGLHTYGCYLLGCNTSLTLTSWSGAAFSEIPQFHFYDRLETDRAKTRSILLDKCYRTEFQGCDISNTSGAADTPYPQGSADEQAVKINSGAIVTTFRGGRIGNCRKQAIYDDGKGTTFLGTYFHDMAKDTLNNYAAVYLAAASEGASYIGNLVDGASRARYAFQIESTAADGIVDRTRYQNVTGGYSVGTGVNMSNVNQKLTSFPVS